MFNKDCHLGWIGIPMFVRFTVLPSFARDFIMIQITIILLVRDKKRTTFNSILIKDWNIRWIWIPMIVGFIFIPSFSRGFHHEAYFQHLYPLLQLGVVYNKYREATCFVYPWMVEFWWRGITPPPKRFKVNIGCRWFFSRTEVRTKEEIQSVINKGLKCHML